MKCEIGIVNDQAKIKHLRAHARSILSGIKSIMKLLESGTQLSEKNNDHNLTGNYVNYRECHIQFDWLLMYQLFDNDIILIRKGTHSDLFS